MMATENKDIVRLLLNYNARINIKNSKNEGVLDIRALLPSKYRETKKMIQNEPERRKQLKESIQKEVEEHLISPLANIVSEYVVLYPE